MERKYKSLEKATRILMEIELEPVQGDRFQPTGFPDLGAAVFERPDGKRMLLVESAQSMANRMEAVCLENGGPSISKDLEGLPYILATLSGDIVAQTSSLVEPHRINSPFIISDKDFAIKFKEKAAYSKEKPLDLKKVAEALFFYDINSLLHGVFMANLEGGRLKVQRIVTGFIEAQGIREVSSGGVKNSPIDPSGTIKAEAEKGDVYGNVPFYRIEYTAEKIKAYFNIDLALIEGYGLEPEAKDLLITLSFYKINKFLKEGLRLRTACDLRKKGKLIFTESKNMDFPTEEEIIRNLKDLIKACTDKNLFSNPAVTEIKTKTKKGNKRDSTKPLESENSKSDYLTE